MTHDDRPPQPRDPIVVAGELARRGDPLSIEAAKVIRGLALCDCGRELSPGSCPICDNDE